MASQEAHDTMLQRSPSYLASLPSSDKIARFLQRWLPPTLAYRLTRARNVLIARLIFNRSRKNPALVRRLLLRIVRRQLDGKADMRHFTPDYNPWDQRLCVVKDGDLFKAIRTGAASVVTDHIERFMPDGIRLKSGEALSADIIIPATGLDIQVLGGMELVVDGHPVALRDKVIYKNVLVEGVPNAGMVFGYTNISWTLKVDIAAQYLCRLLNHMEAEGIRVCVARDPDDSRGEGTVMGALDSGYIRRANDRLPRQGSHAPWRVSQNYLADVKTLRFDAIEDGCLEMDGCRPVAQKQSRGGWLRPIRSALFGSS